MMAGYRQFLFAAAVAATLPHAAAQGASPLAAASFELGRAASGESCRADSAWDDPVTKEHRFDRAFDVQCRGWTDTQSSGRLYTISNTTAAREALAKAQAAQLNCGTAIDVTIPGVGAAKGARCTNRDGNFPAVAVTVVRGGSVYAAYGLERFSANLAAGLRVLAARAAAPDASSIAKPAFALDAAPDAPKGMALSAADAGALAGRWREAVGYSVRGQNVEAREIVSRSEGRLPAGATAAERAGLKLEAALSESNLGNAAAAQAQLDQAAALLAAAGPNPFLAAKLKVYRGVAALNRRDYPSALRDADAGYAAATRLADAGNTDASGTDNPLRKPATLRELNAQTGGLDTSMLRAEAQYVRGGALRRSAKLDEAAKALAEAGGTIAAIENTPPKHQIANLEWLRSQIAVEQARVLMAQGKPDAAQTTAIIAKLRESVEGIETVGVYAGSPMLAQRKLTYAGYLTDHGDRQTALRQYDEAVAIMRGAGPSAATSGEPLEPYFKLLAAEGQGDGPAAAEARAKFFLASQLVNPPLVATQIAQIQKIFEAGGSQGAVLAKTLQDLDREGRSLQGQTAALKPEATRERDRLAAAIKANDDRIAEVRSQLGKDQKYLQVNDSPATLSELQTALLPGEAYLKIVTLPRATYVLAATRDRATLYQVAKSTAALTAIEKLVRASIDGRQTPEGLVQPWVFDVDRAHQLYTLLLEPARATLTGVTMLIAEPTGGLSELPLGVLVTDQASVDTFKVTVTKNSRDYTGVAFLAKAYDLGTSVSPRAFLIARSQTASHALRPYIGFGNHAHATATELATLGTRGELGERCSANSEDLRTAYARADSIGAWELAAAAAVSGTGSDLVEGDNFTDSALTAAKPGTYTQYAVVHFATHGIKEGELKCDNPPALITSIAPGGVSDGLLSFEEIANMQFDANLIVLSACNTAARTKVTGAGGFKSGAAGQSAAFNGLVRAFLTAGGRSVLSTHWPIPDELQTQGGAMILPSTMLMDSLFKAGKTSTIAGALRQAQIERIGQVETSNPYYWAAFAIVGDGEKHMFARAS